MAGRYKAWAPWINHGVTNLFTGSPRQRGGVGPPALYTGGVGAPALYTGAVGAPALYTGAVGAPALTTARRLAMTLSI